MAPKSIKKSDDFWLFVGSDFDILLSPFWFHFGSPCGGVRGQKPNEFKGVWSISAPISDAFWGASFASFSQGGWQRFRAVLGAFLGPSWVPFWTHSGVPAGAPSGAAVLAYSAYCAYFAYSAYFAYFYLFCLFCLFYLFYLF